MFAILISEENLPKIKEHQAEIDPSYAIFYPDVYLSTKVNWYYIRGYIREDGLNYDWSAYPEELLQRLYQCDITKAKTDWDQIVEK